MSVQKGARSMGMKLENIDGGWKMIFSETPSGRRIVWDITGEGDTLVIPSQVQEIRKRAVSKTNCPNLKRVYIPNYVEKIYQDAFDGFDEQLLICCQKTGKPYGYFEGEYVETFEEDGAPYYMTHYGSWLHRSVMLRSEDSEGRLTWSSKHASEILNIKPSVKWNVSKAEFDKM